MLLQYTDTGGGRQVIVFLHYFGGSGRTWHPVIETLKNDYRCIAIDLAGFGNSPAPLHQPSVEDSREDVLKTLQQLQLSGFSIAGHSFGGKIALAVAAVQPAGLQSVLLFAPSPPTAEPMTDEGRKELLDCFGNREKIEKHIDKITAAHLPQNLFDQTVADNLNAAENAWLGWLKKGSLEDISGEMANIQVPVTLVSGAQDHGLTTHFLQTEFQQYFPGIVCTEIAGSGHLLPLEQTEKVVEIIRQAVK